MNKKEQKEILEEVAGQLDSSWFMWELDDDEKLIVTHGGIIMKFTVEDAADEGIFVDSQWLIVNEDDLTFTLDNLWEAIARTSLSRLTKIEDLVTNLIS